MRKFAKIFAISLFIITFFNFEFGQAKKSKATAKDFLQRRDLTKYTQKQFSMCGMFPLNPKCDMKELREFIWQYWTEKKLAYVKVIFQGIDTSYTNHIFIELNKKNQWIVSQYGERWAALTNLQKPIQKLPVSYVVE